MKNPNLRNRCDCVNKLHDENDTINLQNLISEIQKYFSNPRVRKKNRNPKKHVNVRKKSANPQKKQESTKNNPRIRKLTSKGFP